MTKESRKKFYKQIWLNYAKNFHYYIANPDLSPEYLRQLGVVAKASGLKAHFRTIIKLHSKYWDRFHKVYGEKARKNGGWPKMNATEAIKELITRGFMYCTDVEVDFENKYCVKSNIGGLLWPKDFELHQDAIQCMQDFGIPSYTGTTLPKNK